MKRSKKMGRREFIQGSMALLGTGSVARASDSPHSSDFRNPDPNRPQDLRMQWLPNSAQRVWVLISPQASPFEQLAGKELARGLRSLGLASEPIQGTARGAQPGVRDIVFSVEIQKELFKHPQAFEIRIEDSKTTSRRVHLTGATAQAALYAVFDFLERQGAFFGLAGEVYPLEPARSLTLPSPNSPWRGRPRFETRGLLPWPDFLNCITVYNREELRSYLEAMMRMRFNTLGIHVYSGARQWCESFLSFEYGGVGHMAYTDTTATNRWGYLPERTSNYGMGAADFFPHEVFGSEGTTKATSCWEDEKFAQQLWSEAFRYAKELGIRTGVGFEPYQIPDEIFRATPPEAHYVNPNPKTPRPRIDPESVTARDILEARLGKLLESYPTVDYVWLWEDESMNWASQKGNVPLSITPYKQAYDFLKRHAPGKRLVVSGWGGVVRHFAHFHKHLPLDVIFTSLNDNVGWDPVSEEYAKLGGRERWPIPWLEDDPSMWLPQFHVHRGVRDLNLAEKYGCQGILGIHWRNHIMNADAGFQSRFSWDVSLTPTEYFHAFSAVQGRGARARNLGVILDKTDRERLILDTFTGEIKDGHHQIRTYSGDYGQAFEFWNHGGPPQRVKISQAEVARQLRALAEEASSPAEYKRLDYLTRYVEFLVPYSESWSLASNLHRILQEALALKKQTKTAEASQKVKEEGVPLWLELVSRVREGLLDYQQIVSERNELGALASMHNKYERLALFRLRLSMKEILGKLPPEVEMQFQKVRIADSKTRPRAFIPTRPTLLREGERVRVYAVAPGGRRVSRARLIVRDGNSRKWSRVRMELEGRRTFVSEIRGGRGEGPFLDYYVEVEFRTFSGDSFRSTDPPEAPARYYTITIA